MSKRRQNQNDNFRRGRLLLRLCEEHQGQQSLPVGHGHEAAGERPAKLLSELTGSSLSYTVETGYKVTAYEVKSVIKLPF